MPYRAGKLFGRGRGHSPGPHGARLQHSPRVSGCKLMPLPRPVRPAAPAAPTERPLLVSQDPDALSELARYDLITQIYAAQQDLPLREFASYFNGRTHNNVPPCLTSHEGSSNRLSPVIPLYPSFQQSVKWDPNQQTRNAHDYNCRCLDCTSARCPGEALRGNGNFKFKNNVMKFCDQNTMTLKVNDVSCGICLGVGGISQNKCIDTSLNTSRHDIRKRVCSPPTNEPTCMWAPPILKHSTRQGRPKRDRRKTIVHENCDNNPAWSRRWFNVEDEAVRDTDPTDYYYAQPEQSANCRYPASQNVMYEEMATVNSNSDCGQPNTPPSSPIRKILYNEGISDAIANNLPSRCHRKDSSMPLRNKCSNNSMDWCCPEADTWIPYSHKGNSRYHVNCKKPPEQRYRADCEPGDMYRCMEYPRRHMKRVCYSKPTSLGFCHPYSHSPKKMLTSEKDIDSFIVCKGDCKERNDWD